MSINCFFQPITNEQVEQFTSGTDSSAVSDELERVLEEADSSFDLDRAWHAIHYLPTNDPEKGPEPLCYILHGGRVIHGIPESEDGTARILTPQQVQDFDKALSSISESDVSARFNADDMSSNQIFPDDWEDDEFEESIDLVLENYEPFRKNISETAKEMKGLLVFFG